jgi:hypothetical protein
MQYEPNEQSESINNSLHYLYLNIISALSLHYLNMNKYPMKTEPPPETSAAFAHLIGEKIL